MNPSYNSGGIYSSGVTPPATPSAPISSGTPISSPSPKMQLGGSSRKSKKGIVIGAILIVVALVLGIAAVMMLGGGGGGTQKTAKDNVSFYKYANYILNGTENANVDLGSYNDANEYAVMAAFTGNNMNYFSKAQELWGKFYDEIVNNEGISEVSKLRGDVDFQNELMDFVVKFMNVDELDEDVLIKMYVENGFENAKTLVDKNYESLKEIAYEVGASYINDLIENNKATLELYSEYDSRGCIKDGAIDNICVETNEEALDGAITGYFEKIISLDYGVADDAVQTLAKNCFAIAESLGGNNE